jgi:hypothetical protein
MNNAEQGARRQVADFCEQARWTPPQHASIGLTDAHDALLATRSDLSALLDKVLDKVPADGEMCASLRRIFALVHLAAEAVERRIEWSSPMEINT